MDHKTKQFSVNLQLEQPWKRGWSKCWSQTDNSQLDNYLLHSSIRPISCYYNYNCCSPCCRCRCCGYSTIIKFNHNCNKLCFAKSPKSHRIWSLYLNNNNNNNNNRTDNIYLQLHPLSFSNKTLCQNNNSKTDSTLRLLRNSSSLLYWLFLMFIIFGTFMTPTCPLENDYWRHKGRNYYNDNNNNNTNMISKIRLPNSYHSNVNYSSTLSSSSFGNYRKSSTSLLANRQSLSHNNNQHSNRQQQTTEHHKNNRRHHPAHHHMPYNSPYYNNDLVSIPFPSTNQILYQNPMLSQTYFHHLTAATSANVGNSPPSSASSGSSTKAIQSNQIPRSINMMAETNMIPIKGSKWWDIAQHSLMMESMSMEQARRHTMDGRHTNNAIMQTASISGTSSATAATMMMSSKSTNHLLNTMNLPLRKKQRKLVRDNPGVLAAISRAMKMAISECQVQFKDRRWNCPVNDWRKGKNVFGKIVQRGCRETAFVYALTSAAVAHSIARACSEGLIDTCTCDYRYNREPRGIDWEWGGCSDNIDFGYKFARTFVDSAERGRDLRFLMNLHNNEAGRLHVSNEMRRECKCHGMSGSCTVKTCWMRLPSFRDIGNNLKDRFDGASRVSSNNEYRGFTRKMMKKVQLKPYETGYKSPTREDLIYFEESPDFCAPNHKYGVMGTHGRTCNASSIGVDGCHLLCCGRGYITEEVEDYERCNCTFRWCCQVNCKICKIKKKIYKCT